MGIWSLLFGMAILFDQAQSFHLLVLFQRFWAPVEMPAIGQDSSVPPPGLGPALPSMDPAGSLPVSLYHHSVHALSLSTGSFFPYLLLW